MILVIFLLLAVIFICLYCYRVAFYVPPRKPLPEGAFDLPEGKIYEPFHENMREWVRDIRKMPRSHFEIRSFDGLKLTATYYEYAPGAPVELMFHGYRGNAERDLPGGVQRCFACGRSAFVVDQRCAGGSQGRTITFGVNEYKDCLSWVDFLVDHFGPEVKIILTGISMGASTVVMAAGKPLPKQVVGVLADCGYHSQKEIILKTIKEMGLPPRLSYPFVKLAAKVFGGFDLEEITPVEALKNCRVPVIFFHGEDDDFVPCHMSRAMYEACPTRKRLVTIPGAGHGLSYAVDPKGYLQALKEFFGPETTG